MHTKIDNKTKGCKWMSGFIILDVTSIRYVKATDKKTSHDAHLHNKLKRTSMSAVKEYFTDNTFQLYNTIVVMQFYSNTKRQSTMQELLPKEGRNY
jgi:hypothetical protein